MFAKDVEMKILYLRRSCSVGSVCKNQFLSAKSSRKINFYLQSTFSAIATIPANCKKPLEKDLYL